jgi:hypothetical protein
MNPTFLGTLEFVLDLGTSTMAACQHVRGGNMTPITAHRDCDHCWWCHATFVVVHNYGYDK